MDDPNLGAVSETLFLPLYALSIESRSKRPAIVDPEAVALTDRLDARFARSERPFYRRLARGKLPRKMVHTVALRVRRYDRYVREFLARTDGAVVVNLGCGLDDRRRRVDDGEVRWFDLDLPEVIELRRTLLPETDRFRFIGRSVLDLSWMDALPDAAGARFLFVAEGLLMYLPQDEVRRLIVALRERFPGAELVAEVANRRIVRMMQGRLGRKKFRREFGVSEDIVYGFGLSDGRELERWAPGLKLLGEWTWFDDPDARLGWMRPFGRFELVRKAQWTVHYRLGEG